MNVIEFLVASLVHFIFSAIFFFNRSISFFFFIESIIANVVRGCESFSNFLLENIRFLFPSQKSDSSTNFFIICQSKEKFYRRLNFFFYFSFLIFLLFFLTFSRPRGGDEWPACYGQLYGRVHAQHRDLFYGTEKERGGGGFGVEKIQLFLRLREKEREQGTIEKDDVRRATNESL